MEMTKEVPHGPRMFQFFIEGQSLQTHSKYKYMLVLYNNCFLIMNWLQMPFISHCLFADNPFKTECIIVLAPSMHQYNNQCT